MTRLAASAAGALAAVGLALWATAPATAAPITIPSSIRYTADGGTAVSLAAALSNRGTIATEFSGCDATGVADSTACFQAAHDALPSTGGVLLIPPGTFSLTSVNITKTDVTVRGSRGTVLVMNGTATQNMFNVSAAGRVIFEDLQVKNTRHGRGALFYFNTTARVTGVQRVYVNGQDFYTIGVYFYSGSYSCFVRDTSMISMGRGIGVLAVSQGLNLSSVRIDNVTVDYGTGLATNVNTTPDTLLDNVNAVGLHVQAQSESGTKAATTLNGATLSGVSSIVVTSAAGMAVGNQILIGDSVLLEHNKISSIVGTTIGLQFATVGAYANGKRVIAANLFGAIMGVNTSSSTLENFHAEIVGVPILGAENEEMTVINPQLTSYVDGILLDPVLEFTLIGGDFGPSWTSGVHITSRTGGWSTQSGRQVIVGSLRMRDADPTKLILDDRTGSFTAPQVFTARFDTTNQIATNTMTVNTNSYVGTDTTGAFITQRGPAGYGAAFCANRGGSTSWCIRDSNGGTTFDAAVSPARVVLTYSASIATNAALANTFSITATNGTAFTINAPTNPATGQRISYVIRNTSGGALGVITWNAVFKMAAWTSPATANSRSIEFMYDGTNWVEQFRTPADVPN